MGRARLEQAMTEIDGLVRKACAAVGGDLDEDQIELYELAFMKAELMAARTLLNLIPGGEEVDATTLFFAADTALSVVQKLSACPQTYGLVDAELPDTSGLRQHTGPAALKALGKVYLEQGLPKIALSEEQGIIRDTFKNFSDEVVKPLAEGIHREDRLVPAEILNPLKEMGVFGLSVPQRFGGLKPDETEDSMGMVVVTEELSRGSLGAAGSLITRPEIMARALLEGGTDAQQGRWLPQIASGETLCAVSVTEPNTGSDVASVALKATPTDDGWLLNGGKTWCTYAGAAEALLVLARTNADIQPAHKGLSLFVVEKPAFHGRSFDHQQPGGGRLSARAIATLGYRGMHSFEMFYENFFVPDDCLIGGPDGEGKGFYFTMRGFMGGRLQTAARACGLMRAALEDSISYSQDRQVFGRPIAAYPLSLAKIARMGALITASRAFTAHVAALMDRGLGQMEASLVKLFSCRSAEWVTREALQLHGGMGYAEEVAVSRYFADARVLSIFEGAEETLAVRVVGKALIEQARNRE